MVKKNIRFSMVGGEAMARFKHQYLLRDYEMLLKETEQKRERYQIEMQKKQQLLAEVRFLRKKLQSLVNTSQSFPCKAKEQSSKFLSSSNRVSQPERKFKSKESSVQTARKLMHLNQVSLPNDEEMHAFEAELEYLKKEKLRRQLTKGNAMANDMKLFLCRNFGNSMNPSKKRKISWQDQLPLRV